MILALALLLQDVDKARVELRKAVATADVVAVEAALRRIVAADGRRAAEALFDAHGDCAREIKRLWEEKIKAIHEAQSAVKYDKAIESKGQAAESAIRKMEGVRRLLARVLGELRNEAALAEILDEAKPRTSGDWTRRAFAVEALGRGGLPEAVPALLEALRKDVEPLVRLLALEALRQRKERSAPAAGAYIALLGHESWVLRSAAAETLAELGIKEAVEALIEALARNEGRLKVEINRALVALTLVDKHGDYPAWKAWWDANRDAVKAGTYVPKAEERANRQAAGATTFYGIPIESRHVVFVLDRSGSMAEPSEWDPAGDVASGPAPAGLPPVPVGDRKIDVARWQLKRALALLPEGIEFNIIFYNHQWTSMSDSMVKLGSVTRRQAFEFIDSIEPAGRTNIYDPLERGLSFAGPAPDKPVIAPPSPGRTVTVAPRDRADKGHADTVFLLSDGLPNSGQIPDPDGIVAKIKELNGKRKVRVHTIGVFKSKSGEAEKGGRLLGQLAADSGGTYTTPPPKKAP